VTLKGDVLEKPLQFSQWIL